MCIWLIFQAWGVQHVTFIDSGTVSFSNPVRQSLYTHDDAAQKKEKANTAAFRLKQIHPGIVMNSYLLYMGLDRMLCWQPRFFTVSLLQTTNGFVLQIPMPGHPIGDSIKEKTIENLAKIESLVREHDAIFLLTDSRESRWLPTMLAAVNNKVYKWIHAVSRRVCLNAHIVCKWFYFILDCY